MAPSVESDERSSMLEAMGLPWRQTRRSSIRRVAWSPVGVALSILQISFRRTTAPSYDVNIQFRPKRCTPADATMFLFNVRGFGSNSKADCRGMKSNVKAILGGMLKEMTSTSDHCNGNDGSYNSQLEIHAPKQVLGFTRDLDIQRCRYSTRRTLSGHRSRQNVQHASDQEGEPRMVIIHLKGQRKQS